MKSMKEYIDPHKELLEIGISGGLFIGLIVNGVLFSKFDFFNIVYALLAYIVILELTRMVGQYLFAHEKKIRTILDTFIIFTLREIILTYSDKSMDLEVKAFYIISGFIIMFMLFYFRKKAMKESPNETNCERCVSKETCNVKRKVYKK